MLLESSLKSKTQKYFIKVVFMSTAQSRIWSFINVLKVSSTEAQEGESDRWCVSSNRRVRRWCG